MEKTFTPSEMEPKWYETWEKNGLFHGDRKTEGEVYSIVIPPPNVTGILHMGHALNNTIQDILVRWHRMQGKNVVWMPGTDHAGIATQNVVERALQKEKTSRHELGREKFLERVWEWRKHYGGTIINQLRKLGSSCDWTRERFTMDEYLSKAVIETFVRLYDKKLIYRGNYIINWCPRCHTALSDEESEHIESNGKLYYIRYPVKGTKKTGGHIVVATTRPETLLGDVAVAVNPNDPRYVDLDKKTILLPILGRKLTVIKDELVDPEFGTGIVKVTPAHDPNDFVMGQKHALNPINVMNGDGTMNEEAGPYKGQDRFACRRNILKDLDEQGLIEKIEDHKNAVGHCYRCDTVVEPRLSLQWFVKMKPLAEPAIKAVKDGRIKFVPARWTKVYLEWMENIRDWCISRQIWWGHRIPVYYCDKCGNEWASRTAPDKCPACNQKQFRQDEDVLDTWFSSWLWPFSTFGWPDNNEDLNFYYPTKDLVTASDIIFFWVARMIVAGFEFMGDIPFHTVYIHGTVRDDKGRKMSKSLGNSIDPLDIIKNFSADALRFSLTMLTATGQDVYISNDKFEVGRNFGTKIWNATRFLQMNSEGFSPSPGTPQLDPALLSCDDFHLLAKLNETISVCTDNLSKYRFNDVALALYDFLWHQFCDRYVEYAKAPLNGQNKARREQTLKLMHFVLSESLKLLHPIMPFLTEELWHEMKYNSENEFIMAAPWPKQIDRSLMKQWGVTQDLVEYVEDKHEIIRQGRMLRADYGISPTKKIEYIIKPADVSEEGWLNADLEMLANLLKAEKVTIDIKYAPEKAVPAAITRLGTIFMPLKGIVDVEAEKKRINAQIEKTAKDLEKINTKLQNLDFVKKARREVVEQQETKGKELADQLEKLQEMLTTISEA